MPETPCYLVTGNDALGFCRCAGHYLASNPQDAIALFRRDQDANPFTASNWADGLTFKARRSKARYNAMNA